MLQIQIFRKALAEIERLWEAEEGTPAGDKLDILITLVEKWEDVHYPIDPPDPVEAILFYMEQKGLTRKDLEAYLGQRSRVADVLNRKRPLSLRMIRNLHNHLGIPAEVLLREVPLPRRSEQEALADGHDPYPAHDKGLRPRIGMVTLRCTQKLLRRLKDLPQAPAAPPTTRLGDWYVNILFIRPCHLLLCVSEHTLPCGSTAMELTQSPARPSAVVRLTHSRPSKRHTPQPLLSIKLPVPTHRLPCRS